MTKKEDVHMLKQNNSEALTWWKRHKNAFLAALHVLVVVLSLAAHPPFEIGADRALP